MKWLKEKKLTLFVAGYVLLLLILTLVLLPVVKHLMDPTVRAQFQQWVHSLGLGGIAILFLLQITQILIAFIPGEPIELAAGALYGGLGGFAICILACLLAHIISFSLAKKFGRPWLEKVFGKEKLASFSFLNNARRLEVLVFLLFLIPGTPKDMLTYLVGVTPMKRTSFVTISIFARMPSIMMSAMLGANIMEGNWWAAAICFMIIAIVGLLAINYREKIINKIQ